MACLERVAYRPSGGCTAYQPGWTLRSLAERLGVQHSKVQRAVDRLERAGLHDARRRRVIPHAADEFFFHALKYLHPISEGAPARGVPTAWAAEPLSRAITLRARAVAELRLVGVEAGLDGFGEQEVGDDEAGWMRRRDKARQLFDGASMHRCKVQRACPQTLSSTFRTIAGTAKALSSPGGLLFSNL